MIKYIIIVVVVLLAALIAGMIMRRKHHAVVTRLENEKLQIQHYPLFEELTKLKSLKMNGQTEEMFEKWRSNWTEVVDVDILKINSLLFDLEDCIERFQFKKAGVLEREIEERINACEEKRVSILSELEELIGSEEKNRIEMEQLKDYYRSARKTVLAHQHSFGPALSSLEQRLEQFTPAFSQFDELTEKGNYLEAREIVLKLSDESQVIHTLLNDIPELLTEIQSKIPASIHDLRNGKREMEEQNYYLAHLELAKFLDETEDELKEMKDSIARLEVDVVRERVVHINDEIENYYDLLEKEVHAKAFVEKTIQTVEELLALTTKLTNEVNEEVQQVQSSYRIPDEEVEIPKSGLRTLEGIQSRFDVLSNRVEDKQSAYSILREELEAIMVEVEHVKEQQEKFSNSLKNLRIDEIKARGELESIKKMLGQTERMLNKANIPGIPDEMDARLEEAEEKLYVASQSLQEVPLNIEQVNLNIVIANRAVEDVHKRSEEMIENVMLIESLIQYGNRFRASNAQVDEKLCDAEEAFLQFRYIKALEDAASAVEMIDANAIHRIEEIVQEQLANKS